MTGEIKTYCTLFADFIRDNFYTDGSPDYIPYHPEKYHRGGVEVIYKQFLKEIGE